MTLIDFPWFPLIFHWLALISYRFSLIFIDFRWASLILIDLHWNSMKINENQRHSEIDVNSECNVGTHTKQTELHVCQRPANQRRSGLLPGGAFFERGRPDGFLHAVCCSTRESLKSHSQISNCWCCPLFLSRFVQWDSNMKSGPLGETIKTSWRGSTLEKSILSCKARLCRAKRSENSRS